jgi:glycosyltransferase involved in cell wall biosynthesis
VMSAPVGGNKMTNVQAHCPLVSVITPVYNNEEYIAECIESILAQTYANWDYTIVNNCSTDRSAEIAREYAARDPRIRVKDNDSFLRAISNHNHALRQVSAESKYCKMVFADDWIYPRCIEEMVAVAEAYPSVGIVGAYGLEEHRIVWSGLPYTKTFVRGRDICRRMFLEGEYVFGTATSVLYRTDLLRSWDSFFNEGNFHADREVCVVAMKTWDFGFVHQVLTFKRLNASCLTRAVGWDLMTHFGCMLQTLTEHGRDFLSVDEYERCLEQLLKDYYNFLAVTALRGRFDQKFWDYQKGKLNQTVGFSRRRLTGAISTRLFRSLLSPYETIEKLRGERIRRTQPSSEPDSADHSVTPQLYGSAKTN